MSTKGLKRRTFVPHLGSTVLLNCERDYINLRGAKAVGFVMDGLLATIIIVQEALIDDKTGTRRCEEDGGQPGEPEAGAGRGHLELDL